MVVAGGGGGQGREGSKEEAGRESRQDGGARCALFVNRRGVAGNWEEMGELGENWRERGEVAAMRGPSVGLALPRCAGAPDTILPRRDQRGSAGSFIGLAPVMT
jgi:hypothetical protein